MSLHGKKTTTQNDPVGTRDKLFLVRHRISIVPPQGPLENTAADATFNHVDGITERFDDGLTFQGFNRQRSGLRRHDNKCDDGGLAPCVLQSVVETSQRLDKHVNTLISELVTSGSEEVESVLGDEVVMTIEVTAHKVVDLLLRLLV